MSTNHVRIVTDSACDLPQSVADELAIEIVPLTIRSTVTSTSRNLPVAEFGKCAASPTSRTAAPPRQIDSLPTLAAGGAPEWSPSR